LVEGRWWERRDTTATTDGQPHMHPVTSRIRFALASVVIIIILISICYHRFSLRDAPVDGRFLFYWSATRPYMHCYGAEQQHARLIRRGSWAHP